MAAAGQCCIKDLSSQMRQIILLSKYEEFQQTVTADSGKSIKCRT